MGKEMHLRATEISQALAEAGITLCIQPDKRLIALCAAYVKSGRPMIQSIVEAYRALLMTGTYDVESLAVKHASGDYGRSPTTNA
jgi:hypothetical protein